VPKTHDRKNKKVPFGAKEIKIGADSRSAADVGGFTVETRHLRGEQWAQYTALPAQTLYVTVRRDELRQLKDERDQLKNWRNCACCSRGNSSLPRQLSPRCASLAQIGSRSPASDARSLSSTMPTSQFFTFSW
jgi:hypothetical protein